MYNASDLNFIMIVYVDNSKVARIPCNFLMLDHEAYSIILKHFIPRLSSQNFYSSFEIEYQGSVVYRSPITTQNIQSTN
jgi:hypothetical protein